VPRFLSLALVVFVITGGPALAQTAGTAVPEPSDGMLFAVGLAGLIVGRRVARRKDD